MSDRMVKAVAVLVIGGIGVVLMASQNWVIAIGALMMLWAHNVEDHTL